MMKEILMRVKSMKKIVVLSTIVMITLTSCVSSNETSNISRENIIIADQFGLAYAPLEVMKHESFLEASLSEAGLESVKIEWKKFGNTTAIREAMLSGDLDIGFVGIPPFRTRQWYELESHDGSF
jgi:NitT/TauT family transport system substrate-binding protein